MQQYCEANREKNDLEEFDLGNALRIVEALARQPHQYKEQIVALLSEKVHDFRYDARKWLQPLMANLAGVMRLHEAIPLLVGNLGHPYSFLADQSMFALAKIGTDDVVAAVCDQFPGASKDFRLWASDLLCKIHLDVTVQRVLDLPTAMIPVPVLRERLKQLGTKVELHMNRTKQGKRAWEIDKARLQAEINGRLLSYDDEARAR